MAFTDIAGPTVVCPHTQTHRISRRRVLMYVNFFMHMLLYMHTHMLTHTLTHTHTRCNIEFTWDDRWRI